MSILQRSGFAGLSLALIWSLPLQAAKTPTSLSPNAEQLIDVLFSAPQFEQAKLSPDGAYLAFIKEEKGGRLLRTYAFKERQTYQLTGASGAGRSTTSGMAQNIDDFEWLGPDQLLIYASEGDVYYSGLWVANAKLKHCDRLKTRDRVLFIQDSLPQNPKTALLHESRRENFFAPLWCLDKASLTIYEGEANPGRVVRWATDATGTVRLAEVAEAGGRWSYLYRETEKAAWRPLSLPEKAVAITFDVSGKNLLIGLPAAAGRQQLGSFDLIKNQLDDGRVSEPVYDVDPSLVRDSRTGATIGLWYETEKPKCIWLHPQYAELVRTLEQALPGQVVSSIGVLEDNDILFKAYSDTAPVAYYRYTPSRSQIKPVIVSRPEAAKLKWASMTPIAFDARDGYRLHGYLTLPAERAPGQRVPLIALPHGGPRAQDIWGFDPEVQLLAALGYGVLQVNYRGSRGFGADHELADIIAVGEKSVDDVADGIRWCIAQGNADPKKIAAFGSSYGGYISLALAVRYPELLTATIGFAGVYDWETKFKEDTNPWLQSDSGIAEVFRWNANYYPDPRKYASRYRDISPVRLAGQVRCPVLLYHGRLDQVVNLSQTKAMAKALQDAGKNVEMVKDADAVHGLATEQQNKAFYRSLVTFLARNLSVEATP